MKSLIAALGWVFAAMLVIVGIAFVDDVMNSGDVPPFVQEILEPTPPGNPGESWNLTPDYESTAAGRPNVNDPRFQNNAQGSYAGPAQGLPRR